MNLEHSLMALVLGVFLIAIIGEFFRVNGYLLEPGLWFLANISYAGMRAQNHPSVGWRTITFVFGIPGTFLSLIAIKEGSGRAYGIELPKSR